MPPRPGIRRLLRLAVAVVTLWLVSLHAVLAQTLLRDAELERALRELARPVISASGLSPSAIRIFVVQDSSLNAFVANSSTIVFHSGLLLKMDRPAMVQAVIAHEVAHIANGHITRRAGNARAARNTALFGALLAAAAASIEPSAGVAAVGVAESARRAFLAHTRAEEAAADQAGVRYLGRANIDPTAMVDVLELFRGQEALSSRRQDPYVRTHPLSRDRVRAVRGYAATYREADQPDANAAYWYARSQAKLSAYIRNPNWTLRRLKKSDQSDAALVARAVAHQGNSKAAPALAAADALIARRPNDPYAHELRGWIALNARQFNAAAASYKRAVALAPRESLIQAGYGRALLAINSKSSNSEALRVLRTARDRDAFNPRMLRDLALAYARAGQNGMASLSTAERYALSGRFKDAAIHAKRAVDLLPAGSPGARRAEDILSLSERLSRRKKK
ncbi:MAG: M48 family metalloprotease [Pseudomonadota bacterium]